MYVLGNYLVRGQGAGLYNGSGSILVSDSTLRDNRIRLQGSTLSGNSAAGDGGAIAHSGTALTVEGSRISGNTARGNGGGLLSTGGRLVFQQSTLTDNTATGDGGGAYLSVRPTDTAYLVDTAISRNHAANGGGVFRADAGPVKVRRSTIVSNTVAVAGIGPNLNGDFISLGGNLIGDADGSTGFIDGVNGDRVL